MLISLWLFLFHCLVLCSYLTIVLFIDQVHPNDLVVGGWDINNADIATAMERAAVLDYDLQRQLVPHLKTLKPMPSIYYPDFIAANQEDRANNLIPKGTKKQDLERIRKDIRDFKKKNGLDSVIVLVSNIIGHIFIAQLFAFE